MLYDLSALEKNIFKFYESGDFFLFFLKNQELFPYTFALKKPTQKSVLQNLETLQKQIHKLQNLPAKIEYKEFSFKSLGTQSLPVSITFENEKDYLKYLKKEQEFESYKKNYLIAIALFPSLQELFVQRPNLLVKEIEVVQKILKVCSFIQKNPMPNIYLRELPMRGVDTKFIQQNRALVDVFLENILEKKFYNSHISKLSENGFEKKYGFKFEQPIVRFRILDEAFFITGLSDISLPIEEFEKLEVGCENVFIVENKITTLSFPQMKSSLVIFAKGYGVGILKNCSWLKEKKTFYWGDLDMDGFAILSQVRSYFAGVQSMLMDLQTIEKFMDLAVESEQKQYKELAFLNKEESLIYERLHNDFYGQNFRLEQEKIPFSYLLEQVCIINTTKE